jgi:hypothetical protein
MNSSYLSNQKSIFSNPRALPRPQEISTNKQNEGKFKPAASEPPSNNLPTDKKDEPDVLILSHTKAPAAHENQATEAPAEISAIQGQNASHSIELENLMEAIERVKITNNKPSLPPADQPVRTKALKTLSKTQPDKVTDRELNKQLSALAEKTFNRLFQTAHQEPVQNLGHIALFYLAHHPQEAGKPAFMEKMTRLALDYEMMDQYPTTYQSFNKALSMATPHNKPSIQQVG